jgi:DNA gyrase inhibitor GyrI
MPRIVGIVLTPDATSPSTSRTSKITVFVKIWKKKKTPTIPVVVPGGRAAAWLAEGRGDSPGKCYDKTFNERNLFQSSKPESGR